MTPPYRHLRPGDLVGVIAPAGPLPAERVALVEPLFGGWPAGHSQPNRALPLGAQVTLDAAAGTLTLDEDILE